MRYLLLTIFVLFSISNVWGQDYYPPIENYSTNVYGKYRNPENYAIVQDERGVMYFGNSNGVLEYDGKNWRFIQVKLGAYVYSLSLDSNGTIYVGSQNEFGLFKANEKGDLLYHSLSNKLSEVDRLQISEVRYTYASKEKVFFQGSNNVFVYDIKSQDIENIKTSHSFHTSFLADGTFYVRERESGIKVYENNQLKLLKGTSYFKENACFGISTSPFNNANLLFFTQSDGIFELRNNVLHPVSNSKQSLKGIRIFGAKLLSDGHYALQTFESGVYVVDSVGTVLNTINRSTGLRSDDIKSMFEDRDQNLWLGLGNGISKVNYYSPLSFFNEKSGIEGDIQGIKRFNGILYVGSSYGLFLQDTLKESLKEFRQDYSMRFQVWDFEEFNDQLYVGTSEGVFKQLKDQSYQQLSDLNTNAIYFDSKHKVFVTCGNSGVYVWDESFNLIWKEELGLNTCTGILKNPKNGNIWLGTSGSGALRLILNGSDTSLEMYTHEGDGLCEEQITKPLLLNDSIVFGCKYGPLRFLDEDYMKDLMKDVLSEEELNDPMFVRGMFEPQPIYDSIFNQEVLLIEDEGEEKTWYVAEHKLGYYLKKEKKFINKPFWGINYGRINKLLLEDNGVLWIGCADGLIRFKKNSRKNYKSNFTSLIRTINSGEKTVFNGTFTDEIKNEIRTFSYADNDFVFHYACPYFEDEHRPLFSTILEGYDKKWSDFDAKTDKTFTNLPEGDYTFKVKAKNIYDQISTISEYEFKVSPPWYRTAWAFILYFLAFLLFVFIAIRITSIRLKRKNEQLEKVVEERTQEISLKNNALEHKNTEILEQKREIEDSINYAKRIQDAILPVAAGIKRALPNSFILYKPKDIVSGDFYWYAKIKNHLIIVCADCTGHGVPGAFMSMIGSDRLNIIVNERKIITPGAILSELNIAIKHSLKQTADENTTRDGMDAAICVVDIDTKELTFSGAHRGLWIIKNGELTEIKGTKTAIAGFTPDDQTFEEHKISIEDGMKFYMTTDGFADQFGGERGKKFMVKKMKKFIMGISGRSFTEQAEMLDEELGKWMHGYDETYEQVDDVCVMGFELK